MSEAKPTTIKTPEFRASYPHVFKPKLNELSEKEKYEYLLDGLFDKKTTSMKPFNRAIKAAIIEKWGSEEDAPGNLLLPIKDGDELENDQYAGHYVINFKASDKFPPLVVGTKRDEDGNFVVLTSDKQFYGGCYARAVVNAYAWELLNKKGKVVKAGVSFGLGNVQKLRDGERFGGGSAAPEADFDDTPEVDDDDSGDDDDFTF
jgi:hypothetical protein